MFAEPKFVCWAICHSQDELMLFQFHCPTPVYAKKEILQNTYMPTFISLFFPQEFNYFNDSDTKTHRTLIYKVKH